MKLPRPKPSARRLAPVSAFTLVEIAIALAIIGFALVAIIGVLPMGIDVQKNNRRETIINQDANYLMSALRGGAQGLDDLTNYVTTITNFWTLYQTIDETNVAVIRKNIDSYTNATPDELRWPDPDNRFRVTSVDPTVKDFRITNGLRILGVLGTPKYAPSRNPYDPPGRFYSNYLVVYVRALSGAAIEKHPQDNEIIRESAFAYRLMPEIVPFGARPHANFDSSWTNYLVTNGITAGETITRSNYWRITRNLHTNLHDVRLLFRWPLFPNGKVGNGRQAYRTLFSGTLAATNDPADPSPTRVPLYFFQPQTFAAGAP